MSPKRLLGWLLLLVALSLSGCSKSLSRFEQPEGQRSILLDSENNLGQTFTAQYDGLDGVFLDLKPIESGPGVVMFHLRQSAQENLDLRTSSKELSSIKKRGNYYFQFDPIPGSGQKSYFLLIELPGESQLAARAGSAESYLHGALYLNDIPQEAQLQFGLSYSSEIFLGGLFFEILGWLRWLLAGLFLFFLPGWGILKAGWPTSDDRHWIETLGLSLGISLAIYPLLMVFADFLDIQPGRWFALLPGLLSVAYAIWLNQSNIKEILSGLSNNRHFDKRKVAHQRLGHAEIVLISATLLLVFSRFWAIRAVDAPMWGDSVHHTAITQLILDNRGLFTSWEPYSPHQTFSMNFGFSAHAALISWLTGLPAFRSVLITGQLVNLFAVICLLPLAYRLCRQSLWGASATLIAAGLLSAMPAFYVNWGRYSQLAGQAVIPVVIWLLWDLIERVKNKTVQIKLDTPADPTRSSSASARTFFFSKDFLFGCIVIGGALAGMTLCSYRLIIFFITFLPGFCLAIWLTIRRENKPEWRWVILTLAACAAAALLLLSPWIPRLAGNTLTDMVVQGVIVEPKIQQIQQELEEWRNLGIYQPWYLIATAVIGFIWGSIRKRWDVLAIGLWILFAQLYYLGRLIHLPGANMVQVFAILIWLYLPMSLLVGVAIGGASKWLTKKSPKFGTFLLTLAMLLAAIYGANQSRLLSRPQAYAMVTRPDLRAMDWIRANTSAESVFLIEGSRVAGRDSFVGTDAGWWIPILAGRGNTIPPQYAFGIEEETSAGQMQKYVELVTLMEDHPMSDPGVVKELCRQGITHVYIGQRQGTIGAATQQLFTPAEMIDQPEYIPVYHQDRVLIFELNQDYCRK